MIDFENSVIDMLSVALYEKYGEGGIFVTGEPVDTLQEDFPAVSVIQKDNSILERTRAMDCIENHAAVMFEVDIYSNLTNGKKQQVKEIAAVINDFFVNHNFTRTFCQPLDNLSDMRIYRMKLRFKAVIGKNGVIYTT